MEGKVIWGKGVRKRFMQIEQHNLNEERLQFGLKPISFITSEYPQKHLEDRRQRKPRPRDIIEERVMIGTTGPQPYSKKDYLGSHLMPENFLRPTIDSSEGQHLTGKMPDAAGALPPPLPIHSDEGKASTSTTGAPAGLNAPHLR